MIQKKPKRLPADYYFKPDEQDPHFSLIHRSIVKDKDGRRLAENEPNILVPHAAAQAIEAAQQLRNERRFKAVNLLEERRLRQEQAKYDRLKAQELAKSGEAFDEALHKSDTDPVARTPGGKPIKSAPFGAKSRLFGREVPDLDKAAAEMREPVPGEDYDPLTSMPVYAAVEPIEMMRKFISVSADRERLEARTNLYKEILPKGNLRLLGAPASVEALEELVQRFPHFEEVTTLIRNQVLLARRTRRPVLLPPILLLGEAGIGKTEFTQQLANLFGSPMQRLAYDNDEVPSALMGSAKYWSNTEPGAVFMALVQGTHANPVMLLDEIDKAHRNGYRGDPLASLHSLLEPSTNSAVKDISVDFTMDASRVIWIATANYRRQVPQTIRSRFTEFTIQRPMGEHALRLAQVVAERVVKDLGLDDFLPPRSDLIEYLARYTPREQIKAWKAAYASAVARDAISVAMRDMPEWVVAGWRLESKAPRTSARQPKNLH